MAYRDMFLEELNTQLSEKKIKELENQLSSIYINDQAAKREIEEEAKKKKEALRTAFLAKYSSYIDELYYTYTTMFIKNWVNFSPTNCETYRWSFYVDCNFIYNQAKKYNLTPYMVIFGTDYETRNVPEEVKEKIRLLLKNGYGIFQYFKYQRVGRLKPDAVLPEDILNLIYEIREEISTIIYNYIKERDIVTSENNQFVKDFLSGCEAKYMGGI